MVADTVKSRKRVKLSKGDVFELQLPDGRLGYGIVVKPGKLKNGGTPYVAVFSSAYKETRTGRDCPRPGRFGRLDHGRVGL